MSDSHGHAADAKSDHHDLHDHSDSEVTDDQSLLNKTSGGSVSTDFWEDEHYTKSSLAIQNDPKYQIDQKKCGGCFRGYIRQDWDTLELDHGLEEMKAEWTELFFDLIFVACIVRISFEAMHSLPLVSGSEDIETAEHRRLLLSSLISVEDTELDEEVDCSHAGGYDFLLCCFAQFGLLTIFWTEQTMLDTHFILNQISDYLLRIAFMSFILCVGIFIQDNPWHHVAFQCSYIGVKLILIIFYIKISLIPRAKIHAIYHIIECFIVVIALFFIANFFRGCAIDYFLIYVGLFIFEYVSSIIEWTIISNKTHQLLFALPMHLGHISERFGLFIMLILGESIISIITIELSEDTESLIIDIAFILMTFYLTYMVAVLYYDSQPSEHEMLHQKNSHALRTNNRCKRILYLWGHEQIFIGLLAFGIGVKVGGHRLFDEYESREYIDVLLPSYGLVIVLLALWLIRWTHPQQMGNKWIWLIRGILLIIMCIMPIFAVEINQSIIFAVMFSCVLIIVILDVEGHQKREHEKHELDEKRDHARKKSQEEHIKHLQNDSQELELSDK